MRLRAALCLTLWAAPLSAQDVPPESPVLTINAEQLYIDSAYGQSLQAEWDERARALQTENERIERQLIEEEQSLTERRPTMSVDAFRAEAAAFDEKVQGIRRARQAKINELERDQIAIRDRFRNEVQPIVGRLMLDRGGVVVLDPRTVYLSLGSVDITRDAIVRIDAALMPGTGEAAVPDRAVPPAVPAPDQPQD